MYLKCTYLRYMDITKYFQTKAWKVCNTTTYQQMNTIIMALPNTSILTYVSLDPFIVTDVTTTSSTTDRTIVQCVQNDPAHSQLSNPNGAELQTDPEIDCNGKHAIKISVSWSKVEDEHRRMKMVADRDSKRSPLPSPPPPPRNWRSPPFPSYSTASN